MFLNDLKWGIVGAGRISAQFSQDLNFSMQSQLYGVAARKLADAETFAQKYGAKKAYQGYQAMFDDPEIDAVYIATPHNFHFENAKAAINAGKHVLCEKPITISSQEFSELSKLAKARGVFLMEAMWTYFLPAMLKAKSWLTDARIGNLKHIKTDFGYPMPYVEGGREYEPSLAGGSLLDMGIYPIAIAHYFLESDFELLNVHAQFAHTGVDDDVIMLGKSKDVMVNLATSFKCRLGNSAYIIGDKGYILIPDAFRASECFLYEGDELIEHFCDERESLGYNYEADEVAKAIKAGRIESQVMCHEKSLKLQIQMEEIKARF